MYLTASEFSAEKKSKRLQCYKKMQREKDTPISPSVSWTLQVHRKERWVLGCESRGNSHLPSGNPDGRWEPREEMAVCGLVKDVLNLEVMLMKVQAPQWPPMWSDDREPAADSSTPCLAVVPAPDI